MKVFPLLLVCLGLFVQSTTAQNPCAGMNEVVLFQANRIGAQFSTEGVRFFNGDDGGLFQVPYTSSASPGAVFASSPWIGGLVGGELKLAGPTYGGTTRDYFVGPLDPDAQPYDDCGQFNRMWTVTRNDIEQHRSDFEADGVIDDTTAAVFGWPAEGNLFFTDYNGFALPADHEGGWASFADNNQNELYEPHLGEYPVAVLKGKDVVPEAISWLVFNDKGHHTSSTGLPIGVEIQLTIFGFTCEDNYVLNNTLFNSFKVINQSEDPIEEAFFGVWSDYDLGCSEDDLVGSDSTRHTEFVYNDAVDGDDAAECTTGASTYGYYPPVQSMSYLSHPMNSFIVDSRANLQMYPEITSPAGQYLALQGLWSDGNTIRNSGNGYLGEPFSSPTKFIFHGDPRDTTQWSWWQQEIRSTDVRTVSSVNLGLLPANEAVYIETAYTFHQDSALDHLQQIGLMYQNIDSLLTYVEAIGDHCQLLPACDDVTDCVWPGDFDHNGIADQFDMLYWGVMKEQDGPQRNGLINWAGHYAEAWAQTLPSGLNAKHIDGNGNGVINYEDVDRNLVHFLNTTPEYIPNEQYPEGPEIIISLQNGMSEDGRLRSLAVETALPMEVFGLAFEVEVDTSLYYYSRQGINAAFCPTDANLICLGDDAYEPLYQDSFTVPRYMFVKTDHQPIHLDSDFQLHRLFNIVFLRPGKTLADVPDTVEVRLRNLIAIDADGNDLQIGANVLKIPKYGTVATVDPVQSLLIISPNPVTDQLFMQHDHPETGTIYTVTGIPVLHFSMADMDNPVGVHALHPGIYYVKLDVSGSVARFVKE